MARLENGHELRAVNSEVYRAMRREVRQHEPSGMVGGDNGDLLKKVGRVSVS